MTEQEKAIQWWSYLITGKRYEHLQAWHKDILKKEGPEAAALFRRRVNYIQGKGSL